LTTELKYQKTKKGPTEPFF